jgi:hypothetical protein
MLIYIVGSETKPHGLILVRRDQPCKVENPKVEIHEHRYCFIFMSRQERGGDSCGRAVDESSLLHALGRQAQLATSCCCVGLSVCLVFNSHSRITSCIRESRQRRCRV